MGLLREHRLAQEWLQGSSAASGATLGGAQAVPQQP